MNQHTTPPGRLAGKVALVTGAANGIGLACATRMAEEDASVILADVNTAGAMDAAQQLAERGLTVEGIGLDVVDEDSWTTAVDQVGSRFGRIDALLNSAGIYLIAPVTETAMGDWNHVMSVNVTGTFLAMKHVIPIMANGGGGAVVNISSTAGLLGYAGHTAYGASKGAVRTMSKDVAVEWGSKNVRVNSIYPGYIATGMAEYGAAQGGTDLASLGKLCPLGRIGQPDDVASLVLFLASDEASYISGAEITVDGAGSAGATPLAW